MRNKVETFTAKEINRQTGEPKQEQSEKLKKFWLWFKDLFSKRFLVSYVVFTGTSYIPFKDVVSTRQLNNMMVEPQLFIYSVVAKKYLSTIHKKVVDSDEKINAHTDVSDQLMRNKDYGNML